MLLSYCHIRNHAAALHHEMTKINPNVPHLKNITISRNTQAVCDATLEKQVEVLKYLSSPSQKCHAEVAFSATRCYTFTHTGIK